MDTALFQQIKDKIEEFDTIIIHRHKTPDGDAIGSQLGLKEAIKETYPNKQVYAVGEGNARYAFMGEFDQIEDNIYNNALAIICDCGSSSLISDDRYQTAKFIIKIDHHLPVDNYGMINYVDTSRESCCGIITDFIMSMNFKLNTFGAENLYTGICTDSGRFRYSSTNADTFLACSYLFKYPIDIDKIYYNLYTEELEKVKMKAKLTYEFKITEDNVAYLINTQQDIKSYHMDTFGMSRGCVNIMAGIKDINVWVNFTEDENGKILVEFRSNNLNINQVAVKYGGGGHMCASGCVLNSMDEIENVLADLNKVAKGCYNE